MATRTNTTLPNLLTTAQAAEYLGRVPQTLYNWRSQRKGPPWIEVAGGIRYNAETLRAWLKENERKPA